MSARSHVLWFTVALLLLAIAAGAIFMFQAGDALAADIAACTEDAALKQQCYQKIVENTGRKDGIRDAFDVLALLYETDGQFATYCHGSTHELGKIAYEMFRDGEDFAVTNKSSYCGFGFYHGFVEAMLYDKGDLRQAKDFCEYIDGELRGEINGISFACYHGIGHGVIDGSDPSLWGDVDAFIAPGLALCAALPTDVEEHKTRCASGVFNALAIAYVDPKYELAPNPDDPYAVCRSQEQSYERKACYDQMNGYVNHSSPDFQSALKKAYATSESMYRELAIETTAGFRVLEALEGKRPLGSFIADCGVLEKAYQELCVRGFSASVIEHGAPGREYEAALDACKESGDMQGACLKGLVLGVYDRLSPERRESLCADIGAHIGKAEADECTLYMESRSGA